MSTPSDSGEFDATAPAATGASDPSPYDPTAPAPTLLDLARAWSAQDPDATTRAELDTLIDRASAASAAHLTALAPEQLADASAALADLADRFEQRLEFGTAGLRGAVGAGPNRMNRVLVGQAAAGLAEWLLSRSASGSSATDGGSQPSIVVGYDGRTNSEVFARDTAEIMAGAGVRAILLPRMLPTPVLAYAVRSLGVSAGVMVTASHNPAVDNGYKVYLGDDDAGSQIVPPVDSEISARIHLVADRQRVTELPRSTDYEVADDSLIDDYVASTAAVAGTSPGTPAGPLRVVYTAMHGVGWETARRVFVAAGFDEPLSVAEQQEPDAAFPTVSFPNPEEPGALDLALAAAEAEGADLVVANDPDADRLAIAIPTANGWRRLSGNEVGSLLGWRAAERLARTHIDHVLPAGEPTAELTLPDLSAGVVAAPVPTLAVSLVSSPALAQVANAYGLAFTETLTGFKWISRVPRLVFGYEEALGYLVDPQKVRDKDGISAAIDFVALASELLAQAKTVDDRLTEFAERFGAFASGQISLRVSDLSQIPRVMASLRYAPPDSIGEHPIDRIDDFIQGFGEFPASDLLRLWTDGGARVIVRPSGTEPKLKIYIAASCSEGDGAERMSRAASTVASLDAALRELVDGILA